MQEKQLFSCVIRKIECMYVNQNGEKQTAELYIYKKDKGKADMPENDNLQLSDSERTLIGGISNCGEQRDYYFISNHKGRNLQISCEREVNSCTCQKHSMWEWDYININDRQLASERKYVEDGNIKLYYYNLFYRADKYAEHAAAAIAGNDMIPPGLNKSMLAGAAYIGGHAVGTVIDFFVALRFIHLPRIKDNDNEYGCCNALYYHHCQMPVVSSIYINVYPDIKYSLKIEFNSLERTYYADSEYKNKTEKTPLSFSFEIEYASVKSKLELSKTQEIEEDAETQKGTVLYKSINSMASFFKGAADMAGDLKKMLNSADGADNEVAKDIGDVEKTFDGIGFSLSNSGSWLKGSLSVKPNFTADWQYAVSDDLKELKRHIAIFLGLEAEGKLTIDVARLAILNLKRGKKATTAYAAVAAVGSGGLAALPAILIKLLIDSVLNWLIKKFTDGIHFDVILIAEAGAQSFSFDSLRDKKIEGLSVSVGFTIKIDIGLDYKSSIVILSAIKVESTLKAMAHTTSTINLKFELNVKKGVLGLDRTGSLTPLSLKLEYEVVGSYRIWTKKDEAGSRHSKQWKFGYHELKPKRLDWFRLYDDPSLHE